MDSRVSASVDIVVTFEIDENFEKVREDSALYPYRWIKDARNDMPPRILQ